MLFLERESYRFSQSVKMLFLDIESYRFSQNPPESKGLGRATSLTM